MLLLWEDLLVLVQHPVLDYKVKVQLLLVMKLVDKEQAQ